LIDINSLGGLDAKLAPLDHNAWWYGSKVLDFFSSSFFLQFLFCKIVLCYSVKILVEMVQLMMMISYHSRSELKS